jgi:hypothetical protein
MIASASEITKIGKPGGVRWTRPPPAPLEETENDQQRQGADRRDDDLGHKAAAEAKSQPRQQPIADKGADDPERDVGDESEAGALDEVSGQPPGDTADQQNNQKTFSRHGSYLAEKQFCV